MANKPGDLSALSDRELIDLTRAGDEEAYGEIYRRHKVAAFAVARRYTHQQVDREDLVALAFTEVLGAIRHGAGPAEAFRPYLLTCVRRHGARQMTSPAARVDPNDEYFDSLEDPHTRTDAALLDDQLVRTAFLQLPERSRLVLWHALVEGQPLAQVGAYLGVNANAAGTLLHRAKERLRVLYYAQHLSAEGGPKCDMPRESLVALAGGTATERSARLMEEHVAGCPVCQRRMGELRDVMDVMKSVVGPGVVGSAIPIYLAQSRRAARAAWLTQHTAQVWLGAAGLVVAGVVVALLLRPGGAPVALPDTLASVGGGAVSATAPAGHSATPGTASGTDDAALDAASASPSALPTAAAAVAVSAKIAQNSVPNVNPGDATSLRVEALIPAGGATVVFTLPDGVTEDPARLGDWCTVGRGARGVEVACPQQSAGQVIVGVPVLVSAQAQRGAELGGGTALVQLPDGTLVGPIALSLKVSAEPC